VVIIFVHFKPPKGWADCHWNLEFAAFHQVPETWPNLFFQKKHAESTGIQYIFV